MWVIVFLARISYFLLWNLAKSWCLFMGHLWKLQSRLCIWCWGFVEELLSLLWWLWLGSTIRKRWFAASKSFIERMLLLLSSFIVLIMFVLVVVFLILLVTKNYFLLNWNIIRVELCIFSMWLKHHESLNSSMFIS